MSLHKGGEIISGKKTGRPTANPKDTMFRVRLDSTSKEKLYISADKLKVSKSDVVRKGIDMVYEALDEK